MGQRVEHARQLGRADLSLDGPAFHVIRTETVLSRLPMHNLSKKGTVHIHITRRNAHGEIELSWIVSPNPAYGEPRQLAYKLDTLLINQRLDQLGRPLPKVLKLGSLTEICTELGSHKTEVKRALSQNATTAIAACLRYTGRDGTVHHLEAVFTRYSVIWTGKRLPDGTHADAVHLVLSDPYWDVLNNAPVRPLDYDYLKALPPAAQRFYEILSYKMFAALKYQRSTVHLLYSEYCLFSAQRRYTDYDHVKKQMYKVHRPHLHAGYLTKVSYEAVADSDGVPDWLMHYIPGPKAHTEYTIFTQKHGRSDGTGVLPGTEDSDRACEAPEEPTMGQAHALVAHFYTRFHGLEHVTPQPKEIDHALWVIAAHGFDRALSFVHFSRQAAAETRYTPRTFGGILHYIPQAMAAYNSQLQHETTQHTTARETALRERYEAYRHAEIVRLREALLPEERATLEHQTRARLEAEKTPAFALGLAVRLAVDELLEARAGLPPFEAWRAAQAPHETPSGDAGTAASDEGGVHHVS